MTPPAPPRPPADHSSGLPHDALRQAVRAHVEHERRRVFPPVLHAGWPGRQVAQVPLGPADGEDPGEDDGLRVELVAALRDQVADDDGPAPLLWLTRRGRLEVEDVDLRWLRAARAACAEAGVPPVFVVVTRQGWLDPATGEVRRWTRLRRDKP